MSKTSGLAAVLAAGCALLGSTSLQAQIGIASPQQQVFGEQRPTQSRGDQSATSGDRHDVDGPDKMQMSLPVSDGMKRLFDAANDKDWDTAKAKLAKLRAMNSATPFDRFEIEVTAAFVAVNTGDKAAGLASYKIVIASPLFAKAQSPAQQVATLKNAMVLANQVGSYPDAIGFGQKLASSGSMDETAALAMATAYYGNKDYVLSRDLAQKAIDAEIAAGLKPNDTAVQLVAQSKAGLGIN